MDSCTSDFLPQPGEQHSCFILDNFFSHFLNTKLISLLACFGSLHKLHFHLMSFKLFLFSINKASWPLWNIMLLWQCYGSCPLNCSQTGGWHRQLGDVSYRSMCCTLAHARLSVCLRSQVNSSFSSSSSYHPAKYSLWPQAVKIRWIKTSAVGLFPGGRTQWRVWMSLGFPVTARL